MRKLRHREGRVLAQDHTADPYWRWTELLWFKKKIFFWRVRRGAPLRNRFDCFSFLAKSRYYTLSSYCVLGS